MQGGCRSLAHTGERQLAFQAVTPTEMLQEIIKGFFKRELDGKSQFYDDIVDGTKDVYFDSYKAKEYGIVHEVDYEYKKDESKPILENKKTDVIKKKPLCRKWKTKTNK